MKTKQIVFTEINRAELIERDTRPMDPGMVTVKTAVSTVSPGTEKANITGDPNIAGAGAPSTKFPRFLGYSSAGTVIEVGEGVKDIKVGDRVIVMWGTHAAYNTVPQEKIVKIPDGIDFHTAALLLIAAFPTAAIRKTRLEVGESLLVMGLGLLGQFAVRVARAAGAVPVIAADPIEERRKMALAGGADYALDPLAPGFADEVKRLTRVGVKCGIEVTGQGAGLDELLDCMARFGRVALLGCTRDKNFTIDYYRKIHAPGITVVGAHTKARPEVESAPGWFTHHDDITALCDLILHGRMDLSDFLRHRHQPEECPEVYRDLIENPAFPMATQFDWTEEE